ncbi:hypothetical protein D3C81_862820 [compost metagenome]
MLIEAADDVLRPAVPRTRRAPVPRKRLPIIARHATPGEVVRRQLHLRLHVPALRRAFIPAVRLFQRFRHQLAALVEIAPGVLRMRHAVVGCLAQPDQSLLRPRSSALATQQHHCVVELREAVALARGTGEALQGLVEAARLIGGNSVAGLRLRGSGRLGGSGSRRQAQPCAEDAGQHGGMRGTGFRHGGLRAQRLLCSSVGVGGGAR